MSRDGLMPSRFGTIHPKYHTPGFATIVTGVIVGVPALFVESSLMTDLSSIGTLFAFAIVCGGVLVLPPKPPGTIKTFNLPYINGQWIVPIFFVVFFYTFRERFFDAFANVNHESYQEILFIIFIKQL